MPGRYRLRRGRRGPSQAPCAQQGTGYLLMLLLVFLLSLGLGKALEIYSTTAQREREAELVHVGSLYRQAIRDYYLSAPDGLHRYPARLDDLLKDARHRVTRRYLRQLHADPMTSEAFTPLLAPDGGIWGVASTSPAKPLRMQPAAVMPSGEALSYRDWHFVYAGGAR